MAGAKGTGVIGAGSAALRKVISGPLSRRNDDAQTAHDREHPVARDSINAVIEGEIIPRLLMAHSAGHRDKAHSHVQEIDPDIAAKFAQLPLKLEAASLLQEVDIFIDNGISVEAIYLDLLAPAARTLGKMWESDDCDFVDVTMGLWRLQEVMRDISLRAPPLDPTAQPRRRVLFAAMPGDQHGFGTLMMDEIFTRAGWDSEAIARPERRELLDRLSGESFDLVGLTLTRDCPSAAITNLIKAMRSVSANPDIQVFVGGRLINSDQSLVTKVGADGTGTDARAALEEANRLVLPATARAPSTR